MAINIQEILHPSDSDSIKFEKINYNFDQIVANGGGPRGHKGEKGQQGNVGLTGQKGEKGDQGEIGQKGDTGSTDTPWYAIDLTSTNNYNLLKPKRVEGGFHPPVIYIGDETFDETIGENGDTTVNSKITVKKDSVAFDNYLTLIDDLSSTRIVLTGSYDSGTGFTRFAFQNGFQQSNIEFGINVDKIDLNSSDSTTITAGGLTLQSNGATNIKLETLGTGIVDVDANADFKGYVKLAYSNPAAPQAGMIRYNADDDTFEGYFATDEWKELCTLCGNGVVDNVISIGGGDINADVDGSPFTGTNPTPTPIPPTPTTGFGPTPTPVPPTATPVPPTATPIPPTPTEPEYSLTIATPTGGGISAACSLNSPGAPYTLTYTGTFGEDTMISGYTAATLVHVKIMSSNEPNFQYGNANWIFTLSPQSGGGQRVKNLQNCNTLPTPTPVPPTPTPVPEPTLLINPAGGISGVVDIEAFSGGVEFTASTINWGAVTSYLWSTANASRFPIQNSTANPTTVNYIPPINGASLDTVLTLVVVGTDTVGNSVTKTATVNLQGTTP